jgi:hypothetical protein
MKYLPFFLLLLLSVHSTTSTLTNTDSTVSLKDKFFKPNLRTKEASSSRLIPTPKAIKPLAPALPDVLWEGWIKFFHFRGDRHLLKPHKFFVNDFFSAQKVLKTELTGKTDIHGALNVPTKFHFYAKLLPKTLLIGSGRQHQHQKNVDSLNINLIKPLSLIDPTNSSIKVLGSFSEGHCFSINVLTPVGFNPKFSADAEITNNSVASNWVICSDDEKARNTLMTTMVALKNRLMEELKALNAEKEEEVVLVEPDIKKNIERYEGPGASSKDAYLMLINNCTFYYY